MDLAKTLSELREQRDNIDQVILSMERLLSGSPRPRGRPPGRTMDRTKKPPSINIDRVVERVKAASA
jgi:hypothetical protein